MFCFYSPLLLKLNKNRYYIYIIFIVINNDWLNNRNGLTYMINDFDLNREM